MGFILPVSYDKGGPGMILNSIAVKNWAVLVDGVRLENFDSSINVIHGPNESGKSTLMDAMIRGFFDRHKLKGEDIRQRIPWGTDLGPEVTIDFYNNGNRYQVDKRFVYTSRCELRRYMDEKWGLIADGDNAEERLLEILESSRSSRGLTKSENWGLAQVLWLPQGQIWMPDGGINENSRGKLQSVLGEVILTDVFHCVENEIQGRYEKFFTRVRGEFKSGSEPKELDNQVEKAQERYLELKERWDSLDELNNEIVNLEKTFALSQKELNQAKTELKKSQDILSKAKEQASKREKQEQEYKIRESDWKNINDTIRELKDVKESLIELDKQRMNIEKKIKDYSIEFQKIEEETKNINNKLDETEKQRDIIESEIKTARSRIELVRFKREKQELEERVNQIEELINQQKKLKNELDSIKAPSNKELELLQKLYGKVTEVQTRLEASALHIEFKPSFNIQGFVLKDGQKEPFEMSQSDQKVLEWRAVQSFDMNISGLGRLSITSGSDEAVNLKKVLDNHEKNYQSALDKFGVMDIKELIQRNKDAEDLENEINQLNIQIKALIPKGLNALTKQLKKTESELGVIREEYPELADEDLSNEEAKNKLKKLELNQTEITNQIRKIQKNLALLNTQQRKIESNISNTQQELTRIQTRIESQKERQSKLTSDRLTDAERQDKLKTALDEMDKAKQRLDDLPPVENMNQLENYVKRLDNQVQELNENLKSIKEKLDTNKGQLKGQEGDGLYSRLAEAEEELELLRQKQHSAKVQANSVKLLKDTLSECRQEAMANLVEPISQRVTQIFQRIAGESYDNVTFNDNFAPEYINIRNREENANPDALSYGTKEQLNILIRLTLGQILAEKEEQRQMVVLDDPLAHTDSERQDSMLRILDNYARNLQIIILTCHPEYYSDIGAKSFDMQVLKNNKQER
ncbi:AAA family ATPase [Candidatus Poribacteria bacterium]|nr:AAA family ATPase [Candidatus Poribacteria bacterium]